MSNISDTTIDTQDENAAGNSLTTLDAPGAYQSAIMEAARTIDAVQPGCDTEAFVKAQYFVTALKRLASAASAAFELNAVGKINADGDIVIGETRYYVGTSKNEKCTDLMATVDAVLAKAGGDLSLVCDCLSSNAFKPGATRKVLDPETFAKMFMTTVKQDLRTGKPVKSLQSFNPMFAR